MISDQKIAVYLTKYAVTKGIEKKIGRVTDKYFIYSKGYGDIFVDNNDYALTIEQARLQANHKRDIKIQKLEKQLEKLKKMTFNKVKGEN